MKYGVLVAVQRTDFEDKTTLLMGLKLTGEVGMGEIHFPGGKFKPYDDHGNLADLRAMHTAKRELYEETGVVLISPELMHSATVYFYSDGIPTWKVAVMRSYIDARRGEYIASMVKPTKDFVSDWQSVHSLPFHQMAKGDIDWVPRLLAGERFDARVYYEDGVSRYVGTTFSAFTEGEPFPRPEPFEGIETLTLEQRQGLTPLFDDSMVPPRVFLRPSG